jgi:hypothetical protein
METFAMPSTPGTVSKILWHFTGGPKWNEEQKRQEDQPKPMEEAYRALIGILRERRLRIGRYKEVVEALMPLGKGGFFPWDGGRSVEPQSISSMPVTCLADIPIMHLDYHAGRYGKIAIGFHRDSAIKAGFSPVFYQLCHSPVLQSIFHGFFAVDIGYQGDLERVKAILGEWEHFIREDIFQELYAAIDKATQLSGQAAEALKALIAFVKTFQYEDFSTIYPEREWRSTGAFNFDYNDISMIVVPRDCPDGDYYMRFVNESEPLGIPRSVSIVAWDDLVEH